MTRNAFANIDLRPNLDGTMFTGGPSPTRASGCITFQIEYFRPFTLDDN